LLLLSLLVVVVVLVLSKVPNFSSDTHKQTIKNIVIFHAIDGKKLSDIGKQPKPVHDKRTKQSLTHSPPLSLWIKVVVKINLIVETILPKVELKRTQFHPKIENIWDFPFRLKLEEHLGVKCCR
jgi:hypothetical protein